MISLHLFAYEKLCYDVKLSVARLSNNSIHDHHAVERRPKTESRQNTHEISDRSALVSKV